MSRVADTKMELFYVVHNTMYLTHEISSLSANGYAGILIGILLS